MTYLSKSLPRGRAPAGSQGLEVQVDFLCGRVEIDKTRDRPVPDRHTSWTVSFASLGSNNGLAHCACCNTVLHGSLVQAKGDNGRQASAFAGRRAPRRQRHPRHRSQLRPSTHRGRGGAAAQHNRREINTIGLGRRSD